jgi:8-oxo-dGTP pyrophosphatase MutT (NUDIX family)
MEDNPSAPPKRITLGPEVADILRLIEGYEPEDVSQDRLKAEFVALLKKASDPCSRRNYNPGHLTASAVVLDAPLRNILLVRHCTLKRWVQPGGHVEAQDGTLTEAAVRELHEETGIIAHENRAMLFDLDIHRVSAKSDEPEHLHFDVRFLVVTSEQRIKSETAEAEVRWFPLTQEHNASDMDRLLVKCLRHRV